MSSNPIRSTIKTSYLAPQQAISQAYTTNQAGGWADCQSTNEERAGCSQPHHAEPLLKGGKCTVPRAGQACPGKTAEPGGRDDIVPVCAPL